MRVLRQFRRSFAIKRLRLSFNGITPVQGRALLANGFTGVSKEGICDEQLG
jgi:hypothetical protein